MTATINAYLSKVSNNVTEMNRNKNPIKMELFLSFLKVEVVRSTNHLGSCTGWTELRGDNRLVITGGFVNGVEYLDNIQYLSKLHNPYNNYVNPFYIFDLLTVEGQKFFIDYCKDIIAGIKADADARIERAKRELESATSDKANLLEFWESINPAVN